MLRNLLLIIIVAAIGAFMSIDWLPRPDLGQNAEDTNIRASTTTNEAAATLPAYPLPPFTVTLTNGKTHSSESLKGRVTLINLWASWCAPCVIEFPQLIALAKAHPDSFQVIAISVDHDRNAMDNFLADQFATTPQPANFIIAIDPKKTIAQDIFQTVRYPESYLVDSLGKIRRKIVGADIDWHGQELAAQISALQALAQP